MVKLKDIIKNKNLFKTKVEGNSMFPLFHAGDTLFFEPISFGKLKTDSIVMIEKNGKRFVHRIIYKTNSFVITKGDNNLSSDGKIYPRQILGKVIECKRAGRMFFPEDIYLVQSTLYFGEITKIKNEFEKEKIDYVVLKGLPLHLYYEKSHPKRIYADCDVLLERKEARKAKMMLEKLGYQRVKDDLSKTHKLLKGKDTEVLYCKYINGFPVFFDLHFETAFLMTQLGSLDLLYPQKYIDSLTDNFLKEKQIIKIKGVAFPILSIENLILYLALHFFHHNFCGVSRLELLDKLIRKSLLITSLQRKCFGSKPEVYLALNKKIVDYRLQNFVYPAFLYLRKYFKTPIPNNFLQEIKPDKKYLSYIDSLIKRTNIFDAEDRINAGIKRFKNIFYLSPAPFYKKILIIFQPQIIYSLSWTMVKLLTNHLLSLIL